MSALRTSLHDLASKFADDVLSTLRTASLEALLGEDVARAAHRVANGHAAAPRAAKVAPNGRLARRSPEEIARAVGTITDVLGKHPAGLRSEQIRNILGLQPKEMPRLLSEALSKKLVTSRGEKRATTYFLSKGGKKTVKKATRTAKRVTKKSK